MHSNRKNSLKNIIYEKIFILKKNESFHQRTPSFEYISSVSRNYAFSINGDFCVYGAVCVDYLNFDVDDIFCCCCESLICLQKSIFD